MKSSTGSESAVSKPPTWSGRRGRRLQPWPGCGTTRGPGRHAPVGNACGARTAAPPRGGSPYVASGKRWERGTRGRSSPPRPCLSPWETVKPPSASWSRPDRGQAHLRHQLGSAASQWEVREGPDFDSLPGSRWCLPGACSAARPQRLLPLQAAKRSATARRM